MLIIEGFNEIMGSIILSNILIYQEKLDLVFSSFLKREGASKKTQKNYLSDVKAFLTWLINTLQSTSSKIPSTLPDLLKIISPDIIDNFKKYLVLHHTPISTINRRLSALRIFFRCCIAQNWITNNPIEAISNISKLHIESQVKDEMLTELFPLFIEELRSEGVPDFISEQYIEDIQEFFEWYNQQSSNLLKS